MPQATLYKPTTGQLVSLYEASSVELVSAQLAPTDQALYVLEMDLSIGVLDRYAITEEGLTAKTPAVITASRSPFPPDGVASCTVSLDPFVPCTVRVNGTPYALTEGDPNLVLTSDVQAQFAISLDWHPTHWAAPITVLAQSWIPLVVSTGTPVQSSVTPWTSRLYRVVEPDTVLLWDGLVTAWTSRLFTGVISGVHSGDGAPTMTGRLHITARVAACTVQSLSLGHLPWVPLVVTEHVPVGAPLPQATIPVLVPSVVSGVGSADTVPAMRGRLTLGHTTATCPVASSVHVQVPMVPLLVIESVAVAETPTLAL